jgi:hypothetical protein
VAGHVVLTAAHAIAGAHEVSVRGSDKNGQVVRVDSAYRRTSEFGASSESTTTTRTSRREAGLAT